jgi:dihydroorotase
MSDLLLRGGTVVAAGVAMPGDVLIDDGVVVEVGTELDAGTAEVLDCSGCWIGPGFVDVHAHLREPGEEWKEDIESGSRAAAAGGFTAVVAMPNTDPPVDSGYLARYVADRGREVGLLEVMPAGTISAGRAGHKMAHLDELWRAGVRLFTDDGDPVMDAGLARRAMEYLAELGGIFAQHCEDAGLVSDGHMHEGEVSSRLGMMGRPAAAESMLLARDLTLVALTGVRYHALHVTTAAAVDLIRSSREAGLAVTAEATPHHLALGHEEVASTDPAFKMNPPLRPSGDIAAIREAVSDGTIGVVATDHAPHADYEKDVPFEHAPAGVIGLETAAAVVHSTLDLDPVEFFDRLAIAPAALVGLERQGCGPVPAAPANLVVFDPAATWTVQHGESRSTNTPFAGRHLTGQPRFTIFGGRPTWRDGKVQS